MSSKRKSAPSVAKPPLDPDTFEITGSADPASQILARMATTSVLSAATAHSYSGCGDKLEVRDLAVEMQKAGEEVAAGDLSRIEKTLTHQLVTLDAVFNHLALRAQGERNFTAADVLLRLADRKSVV